MFTMELGYFDVFLTGVFAIIFMYFLTLYLFSPAETYYLYFAITCLVEVMRVIVLNVPTEVIMNPVHRLLTQNLRCLSFIWLPYLYVMIAHSLFSGITRKIERGLLLGIQIIMSFTIVINFFLGHLYPRFFDYIIMAVTAYATYIFTVALIRRMKFSVVMFITNFVIVITVIYDVLIGSDIINSPYGELNPYVLFGYVYLVSVILAKKHSLNSEEHFKSQLKFLHAQIEPHFLYNTISTIRACCRTDAEKSRELLDYFSVYLRGKFKNGEELMTSLEDEIELVKAYLAIEHVRFDDRLTVEYDIDENCDVLVPCLIIQPIVENAVKHGLYPKKDGGLIKISIKRIKENIVVTVSDNGIGMEKGRIDEVLNHTDVGIGISNTNERLKQHFGTEIEMQNTPGGGTTVVIAIPVERTPRRIRKRG